MKSAYELAMSRLEQSAPSRVLTEEQKATIREIDSEYDAKVAERKIFLESEIAEETTRFGIGFHRGKERKTERRDTSGLLIHRLITNHPFWGTLRKASILAASRAPATASSLLILPVR
jgi:hypothetical protein